MRSLRATRDGADRARICPQNGLTPIPLSFVGAICSHDQRALIDPMTSFALAIAGRLDRVVPGFVCSEFRD